MLTCTETVRRVVVTDEHTAAEYAALLDDIPDSIFVIDGEGVVSFVNRRVVEGVGEPREAIVGRQYTDFAPLVEDEADVEAFVQAVDAVLAGEVTDESRLEFAIDTADVGRIEVEARIVPQQSGVMVVLRDVTERVRTRDRLETLIDQLVLVNRLLRHDIRNQLSVIKGWAEELDAADDSSVDRGAVTDRLVTGVEKAIRLTEEARDVTTALEDTGDLPTRRVRLDAVVERAVEAAANEYPDATLEAPAACPAVAVRANELLESVFRNLLTNAIVHNDRETPHVSVTTRLEDDTVAVSVADDGPGIADREKRRVFDRDHRDPDSAGTGLGLFLVDVLVDAYGGTVDVTDNTPRGTVVTVRLPVAPPTPAAQPSGE